MPDQPAMIYEPRGGAKTLFETRDAEVLICGPSGTGKSRAALEKVHTLAELHPGIRILMIRKTRKSMSESVLPIFEREVVPPGSPVLRGPDRSHRSKYTFGNGSEIVLAGLDDPQRIMSGQFDLIYLAEATEATEHDVEMVLTRLRNQQLRDRRTGEPWHQCILDCNPAYPTHWLKARCDRGQTTYIESRHEDNPAVTEDYLERLRSLTGVRRQRLYLGEWVAAEGAVYNDWDRNVHLVDRFDIPGSWRRFRAVDFGYRDPFVCLWLALDPDDRLYIYRQLYRTGVLVEDHARDILALSGSEVIEATVCDHDAEGRATLERRNIPTVGAVKDIIVGIQAVALRLRKANDGRPRLFVLRDSLVSEDPKLRASKRPLCAEDEFDSYAWEDPKDGRALREVPQDRHNHALDALRYAVRYIDAGPQLTISVTTPTGRAVPGSYYEERMWKPFLTIDG